MYPTCVVREALDAASSSACRLSLTLPAWDAASACGHCTPSIRQHKAGVGQSLGANAWVCGTKESSSETAGKMQCGQTPVHCKIYST